MKIIVNVDQRFIGADWEALGTGGFRLVEQGDGTFDIHLTTDLHGRLNPCPYDHDGTMPSI